MKIVFIITIILIMVQTMYTQQQSTAKSQTIKNYDAEKKIAKNLVNYLTYKPENKWLSKEYLFSVMKQEPAIFETDSIFSFVYDSLLSTNINQLYNLNVLLNDTLWYNNKPIIEATNNSIVPQNLIEENHKKIYGLYLTVTDSLFDSLSIENYIHLKNIATQCPFSGGDAVYRARAILAMLQDTTSLIFNNCTDFNNNENKSILSYHNLQNKDIKVSIYPNPANNDIFVEFSTPVNNYRLELLNLLGEIVLKKALVETNYKFNVNVESLKSGIYLCKLIFEGQESFVGKVIIIK